MAHILAAWLRRAATSRKSLPSALRLHSESVNSTGVLSRKSVPTTNAPLLLRAPVSADVVNDRRSHHNLARPSFCWKRLLSSFAAGRSLQSPLFGFAKARATQDSGDAKLKRSLASLAASHALRFAQGVPPRSANQTQATIAN